METTYVILEVISQVRLDGTVVSSGHSTHPSKPSLSNTLGYRPSVMATYPRGMENLWLTQVGESGTSQSASGAVQRQIMTIGETPLKFASEQGEMAEQSRP